MGQGAYLSQEDKSLNQGWTMEHNQILHKVATGWEAEDSWADPAFPSLLSQPPSPAELETQWAAISLLRNLRMPVGCTPSDRNLAHPEAGLLPVASMVHLLQGALSSVPPACLSLVLSVPHISCQARCSIPMVLRPRPDTPGLAGTLSYGGRALWGSVGLVMPQQTHSGSLPRTNKPVTAALEFSCPVSSTCAQDTILKEVSAL